MSSPGRSKGDLSATEALLVDVVRLAAAGEGERIPSRLRRVLAGVSGRRATGVSAACREALKTVLDEAPRQPRHTASLRRGLTAAIDFEEKEGREEPVLDPQVAAALDRVVQERRQADRLAGVGLQPTRTVLLSGPPGVGKTMTAEHLAQTLGLPLVRVEPSTIMTSLLGESARRLADTFAEARAHPCVMLLDEFDAFAKRRDDEHELGELKRFVTTLLVEIERWPATSMLVAATNHPQLLDPAVDRRFDLVLELPLPADSERAAIIARQLGGSGLRVSQNAMLATVAVTNGMSGAQITRAVQAAVRRHVLDEEPLSLALLRSAVGPNPTALDDRTRGMIAQIAADVGGLSTRAIGELLGCSHSSVLRLRARTAKAA